MLELSWSREVACSPRVSPMRSGPPAGLVQRCVIIQRDENGFGLTVSGDNPVFVQSVKEDGAAMRAGVQTGDRIIKVNGTFVTHSNHIEVVKLIKSGSYVALTVQGRPPGSPHIPLSDSEPDSLLSPQSPSTPGHFDRIKSPVLVGDENNLIQSPKLEILKKIFQQEQLQHGSNSLQINELEADYGDLVRNDYSSGFGSRPNSETADSPRSGLREKHFLEESPEKIELLDTDSQSSIGSPSTCNAHSIIGAEDDDFDAEQEQQFDGQYNCFQSMGLLKSHPAHLAVFIHHVVSQFDPSSLLCYLYGDFYQQINSKEARRIFMEFHQFFLDRAAHLRVSVPEDLAADLEKRRQELIPEDLQRQYVQTVQDKLYPEVQKLLEDFRQKRSMGLTLADGELAKLGAERSKDRSTLEKERVFAESIIQKVEEVLLASQPHEEEKSNTIQYVILSYMKHLGVKVKESRSLEQKRGRIGFLPKIKQSMKKDKEGEEKGKRRGFSSILGPPRRPSRQDSNAISRAMEIQKQRHHKHLSTSSSSSPEPAEGSRLRSSGGSVEVPDGYFVQISTTKLLPVFSSSEEGKEVEGALKAEVLPSDSSEGTSRISGTIFDSPSSPLDLLHEDVGDTDRSSELGTPKPFRKLESMSLIECQSEDELYDMGLETDPPNWQQLVSRDILMGLKPHEIKQQEVINELFYTERAHVRTLNVLDQVFHQRVIRESLLTAAETRSVFSNLEEILQIHVGLNEQMKAVRKRYETSLIGQIGDDVLSWFSGPEEEKLKQAVATFCSNQPFALDMIKSRQKKDSRFLTFVQDAESNPLCRRQQLKDIIPTEMQRLTKYPLLLDNIAKYSDRQDEKDKIKRAAEHCRRILDYVNQAVREAENKQKLEDYQHRLDLSYLKPGEYPMIDELRSLDLTKRKMIHEGPLAWKVNRDKTIDLYTLLLEDILVLLQKQDDKLILRCHSKNLASTSDSKHIFSPVIKLSTVLVRPVATDNKALFVISMSENGATIYELVANTASEKNVWQDLIARMAASRKVEDNRPVIPLPTVSTAITSVEESEHGNQQKVDTVCTPDHTSSLHCSGKNPDTEAVVMPKYFSPPDTPENDVSQTTGHDTFNLHKMESLPKPSPASSHHSSEHHRALDALHNLGLLKKLLLQQLMLVQKEETENFQRFCSRKSREHVRKSESQLRAVHNRQHRESDDQYSSAAPHLEKTCADRQYDNSATEFVGGTIDYGGEPVFEPHFEEHAEIQCKAKDTEETQFRISGKYLILDGYEKVQESSTDEDLSGTDLLAQRTPPDVSASSSHVGERLAAPISEHLLPEPSSDVFSHMLHYIANIESDLQQLKGLESHYHALQNRLAIAGRSDPGDPDLAKLLTDKG
ncbi:rho guanine nucleotide exchange factor 12 isoform X3 [Pelobates cultripes]|uniref:Rho guanine nucleotide exchange factor 12 isoform X3 n=2 Tax=Pelobates cultripes TaxID=61616 RepID=A0AAD1T550_PELCU|nr:rho guanine nucleotide exchange factor 12 isoform X3 [Pelobates cultripes]